MAFSGQAHFSVSLRDATAFVMSSVTSHRRSASSPELSQLVYTPMEDDVFSDAPGAAGDVSAVATPTSLPVADDHNQSATLAVGPVHGTNDAGQNVVPAMAGLPPRPRKNVFVGNLPFNLSEPQIRSNLGRIFGRFRHRGMSFHRNRQNGMPFVFVEFSSHEAAVAAQQGASGAIVGGRPIRTELANARSTAFMARLDGTPVTNDDLASAFQTATARCAWAPSQTDIALFNLNEGGKFVDFEDHASYIRALNELKYSNVFHVDSLPRPSSGRIPRPSAPGRRIMNRPDVRRLDRILQDSNVTGYVVALERDQFNATMTVAENLCRQMLYARGCKNDNYMAVNFPNRGALDRTLQALPGLVLAVEPHESAIPGPFCSAAMYPEEVADFIARYTPSPTVCWTNPPMATGGHPMVPNYSGTTSYTPAGSPYSSSADGGVIYTPAGTPTAGSPTAGGPAWAGHPGGNHPGGGDDHAHGPAFAGGDPPGCERWGYCLSAHPDGRCPVLAVNRRGSYAGVPLFAGNPWADAANRAFLGGGWGF